MRWLVRLVLAVLASANIYQVIFGKDIYLAYLAVALATILIIFLLGTFKQVWNASDKLSDWFGRKW